MYFGAPLWLLGLIPWAGVVVWMLRGRGEIVGVPFVALWRGPVSVRSTRRRMRAPPAAVVAVLGAIGLAIIAASGPHVRMGLRTQRITIVVDRGATMMPVERLDEALAEASRRLLGTFGSESAVKLIAVPGGEVTETTLADWVARARELPAVAVSSKGELEQTVMRETHKGDGLVVVVSDGALGTKGHGVVQFLPKAVKENVGIAVVAARAGRIRR